jgi:hypothetical protein
MRQAQGALYELISRNLPAPKRPSEGRYIDRVREQGLLRQFKMPPAARRIVGLVRLKPRVQAFINSITDR